MPEAPKAERERPSCRAAQSGSCPVVEFPFRRSVTLVSAPIDRGGRVSQSPKQWTGRFRTRKNQPLPNASATTYSRWLKQTVENLEQAVARFIVVGNEKGGAGKSTVAMHLAVALARIGHRIGAIDLDVRQKTLTRYLENRQNYMTKHGIDLPIPCFRDLPDVDEHDLEAGEDPDDRRLAMAVDALEKDSEFILIDCPGSHTRLSYGAHALADTLITPMNDSFVDFDLLARIDGESNKVLGPSVYSEMVWTARQLRAKAGHPPADWVVVRNRLGVQQMINRRKVNDALVELSKRIGFRLAPGFSERVTFRELFPRGLTLLDLQDVGSRRFSISMVAARQELRDLINSLNLKDVNVSF